MTTLLELKPNQYKKDNRGNSFTVTESKGERKFFLNFPFDTQPRMIGMIKDGVLYVRRDREKHLYQKTGSYGFNNELISCLPDDMIVIVREVKRKERLRTTVKTIKAEGHYLFFLVEGFEKQVFLPLDKFKKVTIQKGAKPV